MSSTDSTAGRDPGMRPWHFFLLLAMVGATWAVIEARDTHPASLLLLSAAILSAGAVAIASHKALTGFFGTPEPVTGALPEGARLALEQEKGLVLRSLKELEFDHQMRKISDADFNEVGGRLRAKAMALIEQLDQVQRNDDMDFTVEDEDVAVVMPVSFRPTCPSCGTENENAARFCNQCGAKL